MHENAIAWIKEQRIASFWRRQHGREPEPERLVVSEELCAELLAHLHSTTGCAPTNDEPLTFRGIPVVVESAIQPQPLGAQ